jgi:LuxR family transcriptional regulator, activator of conjugal transfer of Ti plasmids
LTPRESEALTWIANGATVNETAILMCIQPSTVQRHLMHAREKLGAETTPHAVAIAVILGVVICGKLQESLPLSASA